MSRFIGLNLLLLLLMGCDEASERLKGYDIEGIDVSKYQANVDWQAVAADGIDFVFVKATEGQTHYDSQFETNWRAIKKAGMKRGAYHFFRPSINAGEQARNFTSIVDMSYGDLPPVLDLEVEENMPREEIIKGIRIWVKQIELAYSIKPILYTNYLFYNKYIAGEFDNYAIWVARYGHTPPRLGSVQWSFWQYTEQGRVRGIEGPVDFNVFNGSAADLEKMCLSGAQLSGATPENNTFTPLQNVSF